MDTSSTLELFLWTVVAIIGALIIYRIRQIGKPQPLEKMTAASKGPAVVPLREFSQVELMENNGVGGKPVYISVLGKVYDVTPGAAFYGPGGPYAVFAGSECGRALAIMSTKPSDVGSASLEGLGVDEKETLNSWIAKFDSKYTHVGTLNVSKN